MAALRNVGKLSTKLCTRSTPLIYFTRNLKNAFRTPLEKILREDMFPSRAKYLPKFLPKTKEEFEASALRYGLHPYEYKPFPDDHRYTGDYPDTPLIGAEAQSPFYPWDFPAERRNFNEFINKHQDIAGRDRYDFGVRTYFDEFWGSMSFFALMAVMITIHYLTVDLSQPLMDKQYPNKGVHYTFELK